MKLHIEWKLALKMGPGNNKGMQFGPKEKQRVNTAKLFMMTSIYSTNRYLFYGANPPLIYSYLQFQSAPLAEFCDSERL
jgi:hypothetical protein